MCVSSYGDGYRNINRVVRKMDGAKISIILISLYTPLYAFMSCRIIKRLPTRSGHTLVEKEWVL
jgi:hypothetical protein